MSLTSYLGIPIAHLHLFLPFPVKLINIINWINLCEDEIFKKIQVFLSGIYEYFHCPLHQQLAKHISSLDLHPHKIVQPLTHWQLISWQHILSSGSTNINIGLKTPSSCFHPLAVGSGSEGTSFSACQMYVWRLALRIW